MNVAGDYIHQKGGLHLHEGILTISNDYRLQTKNSDDTYSSSTEY